MKISAVFLAPLILLVTSVVSLPTPGSEISSIEEKLRLMEIADSSSLSARATVKGTVNTHGVRYRTCAKTSCEAVGQYSKGKVITIQCRVKGGNVDGYPWWDKMTNGYYISDLYVNWTGGVPPLC